MGIFLKYRPMFLENLFHSLVVCMQMCCESQRLKCIIGLDSGVGCIMAMEVKLKSFLYQ